MRDETALLIMDMQQCIAENFAGTTGHMSAVELAHQSAREAGIPVIYTVVQLMSGYRDLDPRNKTFQAVRDAGLLVEGEPGTEIAPEVAPLEGDLIVRKNRQSAFMGGPLESTLRSLDISHLVLSGLTTTGVVLSTVRHAADLDYGLTVLSDACADGDTEVHKLLMERVFPQHGRVQTVAEWARGVP